MASLQRYSSHGQPYYRIVESFRRSDGKPAVRVLAHLGKADDLLARLQQQQSAVRVFSVSAGAVQAAFDLASEFGLSEQIDQAVLQSSHKPVQCRDGLTVGQSLTLAAIARLCHPCSKRAIAAWSMQTALPGLFGVEAAGLTSQHFWDQMDALPIPAVAQAERSILRRVVETESLGLRVLAYDTTNFFTHIDSGNTRPQLPQRGHNKQHRHDLRQLGLAMVVSEQGQIPLAHAVYEGSRNDARSFQQLLAPLRRQLQALQPDPVQCTLVFDSGPASDANLQQVVAAGDHYVTALKPSSHKALLAQASAQLEPVTLGGGEQVPAWRTQRTVKGQTQTLVVLRSMKLLAGQKRGLDQQLNQALRQLGKLSPRPRHGIEGTRRQVARIINRQYIKQVLRVDVTQADGRVVITARQDAAARQQLEEQFLGLRVLATTRHDWSTAQIIDAYRGQARVERTFRDLKDPWVGAFRPQHHWTDQKLVVHAFIAVLSLLLGRLLLRRAQQQVHFPGTVRGLIEKLAQIRLATVVEPQAGKGRPRVRTQREDCPPEIAQLADALLSLGNRRNAWYIRNSTKN
jgi:transposase